MSYYDNLIEQRDAAYDRALALREMLESPGHTPTDAEAREFRDQLDIAERAQRKITDLDRHDRATAADYTPAVAPTARPEADDYGAAFRSWVQHGESGMAPAERDKLRTGYTAFEGETRALGESTGAAGGYLVPAAIQRQIVSKLASYSGILESGRATMINTTNGRPLSIPTNDDTSNYGEIVAENADAGTITDPAFAAVSLPVRTYTSKPLRVSWQMLADQGIDNFEAFLANLLAARVGRRLAQHLVNGDPAASPAQPEGYLHSIVTGVTAASASAPTYDELVDMTLSVDLAYHGRAAWLLSPSFRGVVSKIKDQNDNPIWADMRAGAPATLLGYPVALDSNLPAVATGVKAAVFGDLSQYAIRRADMLMLRLRERYAEYGQVGFLLFARFGAAPLVSGGYKALVMG